MHQNLLEGRNEGGKESGRGEESAKERDLCEDGKSGRWAGALWGGHPHLLQPWAGLGEWAQPFSAGGGMRWGPGLPGGLIAPPPPPQA